MANIVHIVFIVEQKTGCHSELVSGSLGAPNEILNEAKRNEESEILIHNIWRRNSNILSNFQPSN